MLKNCFLLLFAEIGAAWLSIDSLFEIFCSTINAFTDISDQYNTSMLIKMYSQPINIPK